jgi:hypothetical protein
MSTTKTIYCAKMWQIFTPFTCTFSISKFCNLTESSLFETRFIKSDKGSGDERFKRQMYCGCNKFIILMYVKNGYKIKFYSKVLEIFSTTLLLQRRNCTNNMYFPNIGVWGKFCWVMLLTKSTCPFLATPLTSTVALKSAFKHPT